MIRALTTAATGMEAQQTKLDVTSNNIANVSTAGFKKSRAEFSDLMYQNMRSAGAATGEGTQAPTGLQVGMGARTVATQRMHSQGNLQQTGRNLDVAIEGKGFLPVTMPSGEIGYTRDGSLKLDAEGRIVNGEGYPIVGDLSIPPDAQSISVAANGTVSVTVAQNPDAVEIGQIQIAMFANPSGLETMGRNLYRQTAASGQVQQGAPGENGAGTLTQGVLELSNVKVVEEMIDLISGQRAYEVNTRVIRAADEMLQQTANIR